MHLTRSLARVVSLQEIKHLAVPELAKAARVSTEEGDLQEERWSRYAQRAEELVNELSFQEWRTGIRARIRKGNVSEVISTF